MNPLRKLGRFLADVIVEAWHPCDVIALPENRPDLHHMVQHRFQIL